MENTKLHIQGKIDLIQFALTKCNIRGKLADALILQLDTLENIKEFMEKENINVDEEEALRRFKVEALEKLMESNIDFEIKETHLIAEAECIKEVQDLVGGIMYRSIEKIKKESMENAK